MTTHSFAPDYAIPPGETLREILEMKGITQIELAARTGLTQKTIGLIVKGTGPITYDTAEKLELALDVPASFWNSREAQYNEVKLRLKQECRLAGEVEWLRSIPTGELIERGYIPEVHDKGQLARRVLKFFGVSSVEAWEAVWHRPQLQFRGGDAHDRKPGYVAAWVRMAELDAERLDCAPYDADRFLAAVHAARGLTNLSASEWRPRLEDSFRNAGVAFVLVREIPTASVSGMTKWLTQDKALVALSLKYKSDDQFWFSLFHETRHVHKHPKKAVFYEHGKASDDPYEQDANRFARDLLIPPEYAVKLPLIAKKREYVRAFASEIGIAPGIVVGRLLHDNLIEPSWYHDLKRKYTWG